jgi:iron complex outermembrane receptor protein
VINSSTVDQPVVNKSGFSPKLSVAWDIDKNWQVSSSAARALRFPTVSELYQYVQVGTQLVLPNPDLKPEDVISTELAAEFHNSYGKVRAALFQENVKDMLIAQNSIENGITSSFTQNVDRTRQRGIELSAEERDLLIKGVELSGSVTYVDGHILRNDTYKAPSTTPNATSVGKRTPYIPLWRATLVSTYRPNEQLAFTLAGRYSQRLYATVDGSDINTHTYQGFDGFVVIDARANYRITRQWGVSAGVNNLNNREYYLFHPFEQRTFFAELKFDY